MYSANMLKLQYISERKYRLGRLKLILKVMNKVEKFILTDFKPSYDATISKKAGHWCQD